MTKVKEEIIENKPNIFYRESVTGSVENEK
jgi:hypothetical protein